MFAVLVVLAVVDWAQQIGVQDVPEGVWGLVAMGEGSRLWAKGWHTINRGTASQDG
jgi:hypothetical protein